MISILIPTYNNFNYLKLCLKSLVKNSTFEHEILFHINDGSDGTLNFIKNSGYKYTYSEKNIGLCSAINKVSKLATKKYILYKYIRILLLVHLYEYNPLNTCICIYTSVVRIPRMCGVLRHWVGHLGMG